MSFMGKISKKKMFLFGRYSLAILPPKKWLSEMGVEEGDEVTVELDKRKRRIIIHIDEVRDSKKITNKKVEKSDRGDRDSDDWQPIPQL